MPLHLENLNDEEIRALMLDEFENDVASGNVYLSPRVKSNHHGTYMDMMREAIKHGDDSSLAETIRAGNILEEEMPRRTPSGGTTMAKVPVDAHITLAEGEFNRFYLRGISRKAKDSGGKIQVYRAKVVREPRPESQAMIGKLIDPNQLLRDLRSNPGIDTALGLPQGPNSGLSGRLI